MGGAFSFSWNGREGRGEERGPGEESVSEAAKFSWAAFHHVASALKCWYGSIQTGDLIGVHCELALSCDDGRKAEHSSRSLEVRSRHFAPVTPYSTQYARNAASAYPATSLFISSSKTSSCKRRSRSRYFILGPLELSPLFLYSRSSRAAPSSSSSEDTHSFPKETKMNRPCRTNAFSIARSRHMGGRRLALRGTHATL